MDVKIIFYHKVPQAGRSDKKMFTFWFNTAFIENDFLLFEKMVLDKACKDKKHKIFDKSFQVEMFLERSVQSVGEGGSFKSFAAPVETIHEHADNDEDEDEEEEDEDEEEEEEEGAGNL